MWKDKECMGLCPYCDSPNTIFKSATSDSKHDMEEYKCGDCGKTFTEYYEYRYICTEYKGE